MTSEQYPYSYTSIALRHDIIAATTYVVLSSTFSRPYSYCVVCAGEGLEAQAPSEYSATGPASAGASSGKVMH